MKTTSDESADPGDSKLPTLSPDDPSYLASGSVTDEIPWGPTLTSDAPYGVVLIWPGDAQAGDGADASITVAALDDGSPTDGGDYMDGSAFSLTWDDTTTPWTLTVADKGNFWTKYGVWVLVAGGVLILIAVVAIVVALVRSGHKAA